MMYRILIFTEGTMARHRNEMMSSVRAHATDKGLTKVEQLVMSVMPDTTSPENMEQLGKVIMEADIVFLHERAPKAPYMLEICKVLDKHVEVIREVH